MPSSSDHALSDGESVTARKLQVIERCKEEDRQSGTACTPDSNAQPCRQTAAGSNLSVSTSPLSPTPASDKVTEQQTETPSDISTENSPDAVPVPVDEPSSASSLTLTKETSSTAPASSEQTPQEYEPVAKQSASEQDKEKTISHETQNLSESPEDNEELINPKQRTFTKQTESSVDPCSVTKETTKNIKVVLSQIFDLLFF